MSQREHLGLLWDNLLSVLHCLQYCTVFMLSGKFYFLISQQENVLLWKKWPTGRKHSICNKIFARLESIASKEGLFRRERDKMQKSSIIYCPRGREPNDSIWVFHLQFKWADVRIKPQNMWNAVRSLIQGSLAHGCFCSHDAVPKELSSHRLGRLPNNIVRREEEIDVLKKCHWIWITEISK